MACIFDPTGSVRFGRIRVKMLTGWWGGRKGEEVSPPSLLFGVDGWGDELLGGLVGWMNELSALLLEQEGGVCAGFGDAGDTLQYIRLM